MCTGGRSSYTPAPVPLAIPGTTNVSAGIPDDKATVSSRYIESLRKRQGFASTIKSKSNEPQEQPKGKETLG